MRERQSLAAGTPSHHISPPFAGREQAWLLGGAGRWSEIKFKQQRMAPARAGTHKWPRVPPAQNTHVCVPLTHLVPLHTHTPHMCAWYPHSQTDLHTSPRPGSSSSPSVREFTPYTCVPHTCIPTRTRTRAGVHITRACTAYVLRLCSPGAYFLSLTFELSVRPKTNQAGADVLLPHVFAQPISPEDPLCAEPYAGDRGGRRNLGLSPAP